MTLRRPGAMGECEGAAAGIAHIGEIWAIPRTRHRAAQRGRAAQDFIV
jgi:hypothetical protein